MTDNSPTDRAATANASSGKAGADERAADPSADKRGTDVLPDRLATNSKSRWYDAALLERGVGIRFNGKEQTQIEEYCVSEGWVRLAVGKALDRRGNAMTIKLKGTVEPYFLDAAPGAG